MGIQTIFWHVTMCSYQWKPTLQANLTLSLHIQDRKCRQQIPMKRL